MKKKKKKPNKDDDLAPERADAPLKYAADAYIDAAFGAPPLPFLLLAFRWSELSPPS